VKLKDLTDKIAEEMGCTKKDALESVKAFLGHLASEIAEQGKVSLAGFGTFKVVERAARQVTIKLPTVQPGGVLQEIPARRVVVFKPHGALRDKVA